MPTLLPQAAPKDPPPRYVLPQAGYVNYLDDALPLRAYYGANLPWLQRVKAHWDPDSW